VLVHAQPGGSVRNTLNVVSDYPETIERMTA